MRQNRPLFSTWIEQRANKLRSGVFTTTSISFTVVARPSSLVDGYRRLLHKIWRDLFRQALRQTHRNKFFIDHREPLLLQLAHLLPPRCIQYDIKLFAKERRARELNKRKWKSSPSPCHPRAAFFIVVVFSSSQNRWRGIPCGNGSRRSSTFQ